jgi:hypothetical protein
VGVLWLCPTLLLSAPRNIYIVTPMRYVSIIKFAVNKFLYELKKNYIKLLSRSSLAQFLATYFRSFTFWNWLLLVKDISKSNNKTFCRKLSRVKVAYLLISQNIQDNQTKENEQRFKGLKKRKNTQDLSSMLIAINE